MNVSAPDLALVLLALCGCAAAQSRPPSVDVTGRWIGEIFVPPRAPAPVTMTLGQSERTITGKVSGNTFTFSYVNVTGGGQLTVQGEEMAGLTDAGHRMVVRRQR